MRSTRPLALARLAAAIAVCGLLAATGCSEWDKYWNRGEKQGPVGPGPDVTPPTVHLVSPSGADSTHATPVSGVHQIQIEAHDDGGVAQVALYVDGAAKAVLTSAPYSWSWNTTGVPEASLHRAWARATDTAGNFAVSDTVWAVVFNSGPQITLSAPAAGALLHGDIEIVATPVDPRVPVAHVTFMVNGDSVGVASAPPFAFVWHSADPVSGLGAGSCYLTAMAVGENGAPRVSSPVNVVVNNVPPRVSLTFPENGHVVARLGTVPFSAVAHDTLSGSIADSLVWTSDLDGEIGRGASFRKTRLSVGTHTIAATAANAWGVSSSDTMHLVVNQHPTYVFCDSVHFGDQSIYFNIISARCHACHFDGSEFWPLHHLNMDTWDNLMAGGDRHEHYPTVIPCKPESSLVYEKVSMPLPPVGERMPYQMAPLSDDEIERIRVWILEGAPPSEYDGWEGRCP